MMLLEIMQIVDTWLWLAYLWIEGLIARIIYWIGGLLNWQ